MSNKGGGTEESYSIRGPMCAVCGSVKGTTPDCICAQVERLGPACAPYLSGTKELAEEIIAATPWGKVIDGSLSDPQWELSGTVHDWRNHVPKLLREKWPRLDEVARAAIFYVASEASSREEWD